MSGVWVATYATRAKGDYLGTHSTATDAEKLAIAIALE